MQFTAVSFSSVCLPDALLSESVSFFRPSYAVQLVSEKTDSFAVV